MPARNFLVVVVDLLVGSRDAGLRPSRGCPTDIDDTERDAAAESFGVAVERTDGRVLVIEQPVGDAGNAQGLGPRSIH